MTTIDQYAFMAHGYRDAYEYERSLVVTRENECRELVAEVRALDAENAGLKNDLAVLERGYRYRKSQLNTALADNDYLRGEVDKSSGEILRLRAELSGEIARRCLGGTPPVPSDHWENAAHLPPETASDPAAPPLRRGLVRKSGGAE